MMCKLKLTASQITGAICKVALAACLLATVVPKATAHTCPDGAVSTGLGLVLTAFRTNTTTHALEPIGPTGVGTCERIYLQGNLSYVAFDAQGNTVAAFSDGNVVIETALVTPS